MDPLTDGIAIKRIQVSRNWLRQVIQEVENLHKHNDNNFEYYISGCRNLAEYFDKALYFLGSSTVVTNNPEIINFVDTYTELLIDRLYDMLQAYYVQRDIKKIHDELDYVKSTCRVIIDDINDRYGHD